MNKQQILLPNSLGIESCINFSNQLFLLPPADLYEFDFSRMGWFPPFSMLYLAAQLKRFREERRTSQFLAINFDRQSYAAHMGFFKAFGLHHGNELGEARGSNNYIPLTEIVPSQIIQEALDRNLAVGEVIEQRAHQLAVVLLQEDESNLFLTLRYSIREIIRNSVEHSFSSTVQFCAQLWPELGKVEIGICDFGIGIKQSLQKNQNLKITSHGDAINLSILPGISGNVVAGQMRSHYNAWENSGYGLFMTSGICSEGGSFFLASGDSALLKSANETQFLNPNFNGTAIRLTLRVRDIPALDTKLQALIAKGRRIAQEIQGADPFGPSIVSRVSYSEGE